MLVKGKKAKTKKGFSHNVKVEEANSWLKEEEMKEKGKGSKGKKGC